MSGAKDDQFFIELKTKPEAKWVCDLIKNWEEDGKDWGMFDDKKSLDQYWLDGYTEHCDKMESLVYAAWKKYCEKK